jgi:exonuclease III
MPNKKNITFLVAHFPSQSNPTEWRAQAVQYAKNLMAEYQKEGRSVILGGDLNIIKTEESEKSYFKNELSQVGKVSHLVCSSCSGTHFYRGSWSHLDVFVYSNNLTANGFELIPESIQVVKTQLHMKRNGTPLRFNAEKKEGVSDHFPLYSRLKILN